MEDAGETKRGISVAAAPGFASQAPASGGSSAGRWGVGGSKEALPCRAGSIRVLSFPVQPSALTSAQKLRPF